MDEDRFNISVRKFLKEVGVTSQRELERAVREALNAGTLKGGDTVEMQMVLEGPTIGVRHVVTGRLDVG
ncbi:MAG: DUF6494 family protein [Candidatus Elarobacter sp.]